MTNEMRGAVEFVDQCINEIGLDAQVERARARPVRGATIAAEVGRNHFELRPKSRSEFGPLSTRMTRTMQKHNGLASTDGEVLATDAADVDAGDAHDPAPAFNQAARMDAREAASKPCLISETMSLMCSIPTDSRT